MRGWLLSVGSVVLTSLVIGNAYYQKQQFYPSVVYITKSNPSLAVGSPVERSTRRLINVLFCIVDVYHENRGKGKDLFPKPQGAAEQKLL